MGEVFTENKNEKRTKHVIQLNIYTIWYAMYECIMYEELKKANIVASINTIFILNKIFLMKINLS